jgi:hypothetical protein
MPNNEWSGILFYTYSGLFEDNSLEIKCVDILLMDIGGVATTEFNMSPEVISYMTDHPELLDCQTGLIHSHHSMSTFFSGTDTATLRAEGNDRNIFVSLIVNNAGTYTAGITRKVTSKKLIKDSISYKFFEDKDESSTSNYAKEETVIEWFNLAIIKEGLSADFTNLDTRINELRKAKEKSIIQAKRPTYDNSKNLFSNDYGFNDYISNYSSINDYSWNRNTKQNSNLDKGNIKINEETVKSAVVQIVTGSIAVANTKINIKQWVKSMPTLFDKRFTNMELYRMWAEQHIEFIITYDVPVQYSDAESESEYICTFAKAISDFLSKLPKNKYIEELIDILEAWMII